MKLMTSIKQAFVLSLISFAIVQSTPAFAFDPAAGSAADSMEVSGKGVAKSEDLAKHASFEDALKQCTDNGFDSYDEESVQQNCNKRTVAGVETWSCTTTLTCLKGEAT